MSINFALCKSTDKEKIVKFMDENWGEKHPLIHCDEFFNFYYKALNSDELQFATASENNEILAIAGYIYTSNTAQKDIWVSIWCAKKGKNGIGLELMDALPKLTGAKIMACNNIRKNTMPFYTFLGYTAERLPHYYRLCQKNEYKIAIAKNAVISPFKSDAAILKLIENEAALQSEFAFIDEKNFHTPKKDLWYINRRYFNYPMQKYEVYGVYLNGVASAIFAMRTIDVNGTNVLRILDYIGSEEIFIECGGAIDALMRNKNAEYADCYCYGISKEAFSQIGFNEREENSEIIIPNYLSPPLYENTEYYFFTSDAENFTMFKADGDQDRPNITL